MKNNRLPYPFNPTGRRKMNRLLLYLGVWSCTFLPLIAQNTVFDPLLDASCKILPVEEATSWNSSYMWYPGQLSAHLQRIQKEKSAERCVNVGYPGNFTKDAYRTFFRKELTLSEETEICWNATGNVTFSINGKKQNTTGKGQTVGTGTFKLMPGKHLLLFDVTTDKQLPALIVKGENAENIEKWQVSLDDQHWNLPETDARYNKQGKSPDDEQELTVSIPAKQFIIVRNATHKNGILEIGKNGCLLVDFHHLEVGSVILQASGSGRISFSVGESPEEALNENVGSLEQKAVKTYVLTDKIQEIRLPERALRYLKISCDHPSTVASIRCDAKVWPVEFRMQFESDNEALNNLWRAGIATLHTSMHNFYLDGVKRDYLPWSMDAIISALGGDYVFGDRQVARNGISIALMPFNPKISDWGIVDYPLHALIGLKQDYLHYGDLSTSLMFKDRILQQLALYESIQDENGFLAAAPPTTGFIPGWSRKMGPDDFGIAAYGQMMLYQNFKIATYFARLWKEHSLARHYERKAGQLGKNIITYFWDNERKAFINGYRTDGSKDDRISHHAQYWGVLTGLYPEENYPYLFDKVIPSIPFYKENISYEKGYECLAYIKAGRIKEMFALLDDVWGDWLRQGNTRFPENFSLNSPLEKQLTFYERPFGLSLCHGANGVPPIIAILHGIYGFSQSDQQISEYTLRPDLLELNWAKGRISVKEGYINLNLTKQGNCSIEIPDNCIVRLYPGKQSKAIVWKKGGTYSFTIQ